MFNSIPYTFVRHKVYYSSPVTASTTSTHKYSPYHSLDGLLTQTIDLSDNFQFPSPATEEWLNQIPTLNKQVHNTLKQIHIKSSAVHVKKARQFNFNNQALVNCRNFQIKAGNNRSLTN